MAIINNSKMDIAFNDLLSRQDYLVTQANDLARSFGNLSVFEHKLLDFCFSYVQPNDKSEKIYSINIIDIIHHFGLGASGASYKRVIKSFKGLNEKTAIYMQIIRNGVKGVMMTSLFDSISILGNGIIEFQFSQKVAPYVFQLKKQFYSFRLSELANVRSKYTLSLMKLWNANSIGKMGKTRIQGTLEEWESWFLGSDKDGNPKYLEPGVFKRDILNRAIRDLAKIYPKTIFDLTTVKRGVRVVGYILEINPVNTSLDI